MSLAIRNIASSLFVARPASRSATGPGSALAEAMERLNAGIRVSRARDDPSGVVLSASLTAIVGGYGVGRSNTTEGISMVDISRSALGVQTTLVQRIRELAVQSASTATFADDRSVLDAQAQALITEVGRVARAAQFKQLPLLDGTLGAVELQVGPRPYDTVALRFDRTTTAMALGLLGGTLGPATYSITGSNVNGSFASGDLAVNGASAGSQGDAAEIAGAINAINSQFGATASNEVSGVSFTSVTGSAAIAAVPTVAVQTGAFVVGVSDGANAVPSIANQSGAFVAGVSDGANAVPSITTQSGAFVAGVSDGANAVPSVANQSGAFVAGVSDGAVAVATVATLSGPWVAPVSDGTITQPGVTGPSGFFATVTPPLDNSWQFTFSIGGTSIVDVTSDVVTAADMDAALAAKAALLQSAEGITFTGSVVGGDLVFTKAGGGGIQINVVTSADTTFPAVISNPTMGFDQSAFGAVGGFNENVWGSFIEGLPSDFKVTVDGTTVIQKAGGAGVTVTNAEMDAAFTSFASASAGAYTFGGSFADGSATLQKADGSALDIQIPSNFTGTPGTLPGFSGITNNGTPAVASTTPFELKVDGAVVLQKNAAPGATVTDAELDAALSAFAAGSSGAYSYTGSLVNGDASLTKADGSTLDVQITSNFAGTAVAMPGLTGTTSNGSVATPATTPFELQVDGTSIFQKNAAPGATVSDAELDAALSAFAAGSSGAYSYTGSLVNGDASLTKADGSTLDVQITSNFAGTAVALPGLTGTTSNGSVATPATTPFVLQIDGTSIFQKNAAPGATVSDAELDAALTAFAAGSSGAYSYTGSLVNGDASLTKADGSTLDVQITSNFAGTAVALPGLTGTTSNGSVASPATTPFLLKMDGALILQKNAAPGTTVSAAELDSAFTVFASGSNGAYSYSGSLVNGDARLTKADGSQMNVEITSNFAGTPVALPGLQGVISNGTPGVAAVPPDYALSVNGFNLDLGNAKADYEITIYEIANEINNVSGMSAYVAGGALTLKKNDGGNITLTESGSGASGGLLGGAGSTVYRGVVTISALVPVTIGGNDPQQAGLQPGTLVAQLLDYTPINVRDIESANIAVRVTDLALNILQNYSTIFGGSLDRLTNVMDFISSVETVSERARDRALDRSSAAETVQATRLQILRDGSSALLAQANVNTRTVLSLLKQKTPTTGPAVGVFSR